MRGSRTPHDPRRDLPREHDRGLRDDAGETVTRRAATSATADPAVPPPGPDLTFPTTAPAPPDSIRITDFPAYAGGCAACSEDLDYGCSAIPVDHGYVHDDCWDDYLSLLSSPPAPTEIS